MIPNTARTSGMPNYAIPMLKGNHRNTISWCIEHEEAPDSESCHCQDLMMKALFTSKENPWSVRQGRTSSV